MAGAAALRPQPGRQAVRALARTTCDRDEEIPRRCREGF